MDDDLPFSPGQRLTVDEVLDEDWYHGHYVDSQTDKRLEGVFPVNYVEIELPPSRPHRRVPPPAPKQSIAGEPTSSHSAPAEDSSLSKETLSQYTQKSIPDVLEARKSSFSASAEAENDDWSDDEQEQPEKDAKDLRFGAPKPSTELPELVAKEAAGVEHLPSALQSANVEDELHPSIEPRTREKSEVKAGPEKPDPIETAKAADSADRNSRTESAQAVHTTEVAKDALGASVSSPQASAAIQSKQEAPEKRRSVFKTSNLASEATEVSDHDDAPSYDLRKLKLADSQSNALDSESSSNALESTNLKSTQPEAHEKVDSIDSPQQPFKEESRPIEDKSESEHPSDSRKNTASTASHDSIADNSKEPDFKTRLARFNQGAAIDPSDVNMKRPERHPTFGRTLNFTDGSEESHPPRENMDEYKPSVSFKERLAMLQKSQEEEATSAQADAAAEERRKARRAKLAQEAEANRKARLEAEAIEKERQEKEEQELQDKAEASRKIRDQEEQAKREESASAAPPQVPGHTTEDETELPSTLLESRTRDFSFEDGPHPPPVTPQPAIPQPAEHDIQSPAQAPELSSHHETSVGDESSVKSSTEPIEDEDNEEDNAEARRIALRERMARLANSTGGVNLGMIMGGGRSSGGNGLPKRERRISRSEYEAMSAAEIEAAEARREAEESAPVNIFGGAPPPKANPHTEKIETSGAEHEEAEAEGAEDEKIADATKPGASIESGKEADTTFLGDRVAEPQSPQVSYSHADPRSPGSDDFHDAIEQQSPASLKRESLQRIPSVERPAANKARYSEWSSATRSDDNLDFEFGDEPNLNIKDVSAENTAKYPSVPPHPPQASSTAAAAAPSPPTQSLPTQIASTTVSSSPAPTRPAHPPTTSESVRSPPPPPPHAPVPSAPGGPQTASPSAPPTPHHQPTPTRSLPTVPASAPPPPAPGARPPPPVPTQTRAPPAPPVAAPAAPEVSVHPPAPPAPPTQAPAPSAPPPPPQHHTTVSAHPPAPPSHAPQAPNSPPHQPASISRPPTFGSSAPPPPVAKPVDDEQAPIQRHVSRSSQRSQELARSGSTVQGHSRRSSWLSSSHGVPPGILGAGDAFKVKNSTNQRRVLVLHPDWTHTVYKFSTATGEQISKMECIAPHMDPHELKDVSSRLGSAIVAAAQDDVQNLDQTASSVVRLLESNGALVVGKSFGMEIYTNIGNASVQQHDEIRPGDICVCEDASFQGQRGPLQKYSKTYKDSVFVIGEWDGTKRKLHFVDNKKETARLGDLRMGVVRVFRAVDSKFLLA